MLKQMYYYNTDYFCYVLICKTFKTFKNHWNERKNSRITAGKIRRRA
jgi:hypothetical protein